MEERFLRRQTRTAIEELAEKRRSTPPNFVRLNLPETFLSRPEAAAKQSICQLLLASRSERRDRKSQKNRSATFHRRSPRVALV